MSFEALTSRSSTRPVAKRPFIGAAGLVMGLGSWLGAASTGHASPPIDGAPSKEATSEQAGTGAAPGGDGPVDESPKARARRWFESGVREAKAENYVAAGEAFDQSYEAIAAPATLYNAAWAYDHGEDWVRAVLRYRSYLARYPTDADAAEVERALVRVEAEVAELGVSVVGARGEVEVRIDGEPIDPSGPPVVVLPSTVSVEVRDAEGHSRREEVALRPGQRRSIEIVFSGEDAEATDSADTGESPEGPAAPTGAEGPVAGTGDEGRTPSPRRWARPAMWGGVSLAVAGSIGVAVLAPLTRREARRFESALCTNPCAEGSAYPADIERRFEGYRAGTNAMIAMGAVGATGALIFGLLARDTKRRKDTARIRPTATGLRLDF